MRHEHLFFLEDGRPISDPEITRWRWSESIKALNIRRRGPYHAIKKAMEKTPVARAAFLDSRTAISAVNTVSNRVTQIVIRPPKSPEFGSSLAVGKDLSDSSLRNASKIKWRRGWDRLGPSWPSPCGRAARVQNRSGDFVEPT
jgi:hypothetical protein